MSVKIGTPLSQRAKKVLLCGSGELGKGLFGVELFIKGDEVIFSEVSARRHDTGLVTLVSQDLSEFALHARENLSMGQAT
jgi:phosphoribosylglycinamide formyltransferase 2